MTYPRARSTIEEMARYQPNLSAPSTGRIIRLSANEGAFGPSPKAIKALNSVAQHIHWYPEEEPAALAEALGSKYSLDPDRMIFGCGSDELIMSICQAYLDPGDEAIHTEYGFIMYPMSIRVAGGVPISAPDRNYTVDIDAVLERITDKTKIVFIANPNNPTGSYLSHTEVSRLHQNLPHTVLLVLDSAYSEFVVRNDYSSGAELVEISENVVMLRTFSKLYGLAGLRLGWGYAPKHVIDAIHVVKQPFGANRAAVSAALAALDDQKFIDKSVKHNEIWRTWTSTEFEKLGLYCLPSVANFLMVRFPSETGRTAVEAGTYLSNRGILTRGMSGYGASDYLRLSIGTQDEMKIVVKTVSDFLNEKVPSDE
ncbi:MAG: histidinol-phosphate transaminase [Rhodospirillaceae bacterium]|nr:histidinol-phosphate transaminase [Rhodospirillaceae bacterium]